MPKPVLVSGIQPSGRLHIGNYLGALKNFVDLQNSGKYQCYFFLADLHALTENPEPKNLSKNILNLTADFLAAGLDPKKSIIFQQSQIEALQELKWTLSTLAPVSELLRMTQFKDKVLQALKPEEQERVTKEKFEEVVEGSNFGLAEYPVLMAADILMYSAKFVPVGSDQLQHLEFARTLARKFNTKFGKTFIEPQALLTKAPRVMSLKNPEKKMSKSQPDTCLFLDDSPAEIETKIKTAVTDSGGEIKYDPKEKPGISNLLQIYSALRSMPIEKLESHFVHKNYGEFKRSLVEVVVEHFEPFRKRKAAFIKNPAALKKVLNTGSAQAGKVAARKIAEVKKKIGLAL